MNQGIRKSSNHSVTLFCHQLSLSSTSNSDQKNKKWAKNLLIQFAKYLCDMTQRYVRHHQVAHYQLHSSYQVFSICVEYTRHNYELPFPSVFAEKVNEVQEWEENHDKS